MTYIKSDIREYQYKSRSKTIYNRDCSYRKEDPATIIKWMRRNFGERHHGWDFSFVGGKLVIEIWDDELKFMYEMWQM